jgi:hypothetical protein
MMVENHAKGKIAWPNHGRVTVAITFDFQGGEPVRPGPNGKMNNEDYAEGEYGPKTVSGGSCECWMKSKSRRRF